MERCRVCILPRNYSAVTFDAGGTCSMCRVAPGAPEPRVAEASQAGELDRIVDEARSAAAPYDCLVPISGGQDSAYVAYLLVRRFGLRPLGVNFDSGYRSELALANMEQLSRVLRMDIVTLKPNSDLLHRTYAHFFRRCGYFCTACNALGYIVIGSFAFREGRRTGRNPLLVGGWSRKYEYQPGLSVLSMTSFGKALRRAPALFHELRGSALVEPKVFDAFVTMGDVREMFSARPGGGGSGAPSLRAIHLPSYMDWDYREIASTLEREVGWRRPEGRRDAHFDCRLAPLQEYLKVRRFGFGQMTIKNSVLVREGRMSREEALSRAELEQRTEPVVLQEALADWGLTRDEVAWDAQWAG